MDDRVLTEAPILKRFSLEGKTAYVTGAAQGIGRAFAHALAEAGADSFGVGSYIARAPAIDMTMDLKEVHGKAVAKRGRIPGIIGNDRLVKVI